jgi:hypothetical protein
MATFASDTKKADSPASAALIEIARLLARQAAREWAEATKSAHLPQTTSMGPQE